MSKMVGIVAMAIFERMVANQRAYLSSFQDVTIIGDDEREIVGKATTIDGDFDLEDIARAVIAAMREPTETMVKEAYYDALAENALGVWHTMIDEALK